MRDKPEGFSSNQKLDLYLRHLSIVPKCSSFGFCLRGPWEKSYGLGGMQGRES